MQTLHGNALPVTNIEEADIVSMQGKSVVFVEKNLCLKTE